MSKPKVLIVCVSKEHGNTRRVAEAMAAELDASVVEPRDLDADAMEECGLVGFGSGIRFGRHYRELFDLVGRLPRQQGRRAFLFSTSGFGFLWWHGALRKRLLARGFDLRDEFCCKALDTLAPIGWFGGVNRGRPDQGDLSAAREFARRLL
jgi:flavodoxin